VNDHAAKRPQARRPAAVPQRPGGALSRRVTLLLSGSPEECLGMLAQDGTKRRWWPIATPNSGQIAEAVTLATMASYEGSRWNYRRSYVLWHAVCAGT